ncbi:hypothetical protein ACP8HI_05720 [Paenibacillus sp. FA6]|uniref:hypothetical protein n=1 Tax=Paenibacillus sp. FA6 TaxID=3413029 RepID=UPI003F658DAD
MEPWIIIIMLGAAALIYAVMLPRKKIDKTSSELMVKEVESTLEQYMADIEAENDTLVELVGQMKKETTTRQTILEESLIEMQQRLLLVEKQSAEYELRLAEIKQDKILHASTLAEMQTAATEVITLPELEESAADSEPVNSIKQRYSEVFELHEQGKSIDVIGKLIGIQRGEVQLILQLAKQEGTL